MMRLRNMAGVRCIIICNFVFTVCMFASLVYFMVECAKINASGKSQSDVILAEGAASAETKRAEGAKMAADLLSQNDVAVELTKMERSARMLRGGEKYFFGESPEMLSNIILKGAV